MKKDKYILVIGDVGIDHYIFGKVTRVSPEAPVPILEKEYEEIRLGLAANVANNVKKLGSEVRLISATGNDLSLTDLIRTMEKSEINISDLISYNTRKTTKKLRLMSGHHQLARLDDEITDDLESYVEIRTVSRTKFLISNASAVIIQDYAKGFCTTHVVRTTMKLANKLKIPVLIDPNKNSDPLKYIGADIITPNLSEAQALVKNNSDNIKTIGREIIKKFNIKTVIITLGAKGVALITKDKYKVYPSQASLVYDVTGAGDTFIAALAVAITKKKSIENACKFANKMAGKVVGKIGTSTV